MMKIEGSGSASGSESGSASGSESGSNFSQRHGSADPDPHPDPHQNVMDPEHCFKAIQGIKVCQLLKIFNAGKIKIGCNVCGVKIPGANADILSDTSAQVDGANRCCKKHNSKLLSKKKR
jgi:hypothetical protein